MGNDKIHQLLIELKQQLESTEIDESTLAMLADFDREIHDSLAAVSHSTTSTSLVDTAKELETRFAASHPLIERCMREIADTLGKMGI